MNKIFRISSLSGLGLPFKVFIWYFFVTFYISKNIYNVWNNLYNKLMYLYLYIYIYIYLAKAGQMAGPNWLKFCDGNPWIRTKFSSERNVSRKSVKIFSRISQTFPQNFARKNVKWGNFAKIFLQNAKCENNFVMRQFCETHEFYSCNN